MKQWTKNNMKLLSKWRAKKREGEYDEENGIIIKQSNNSQNQQQQQPIHKELFYFFLRRSWKKKLFTALVVLTLIPVLYDLFILQDSGIVTKFIDRFLEWMAEHPISGVWAYISMIILTSLIFVPPSILIFAAGFTFASLWRDNGVGCGILIALIASFLGSTLGGLIGFVRARYMTRDIMIEVLMKRYPIIKAVDAAIVKNSLHVMILLRLNSLIPFGVLNYVFGITGVDWAAFVLAMVGILPWQLLLICLGASAESMYNTGAGTETTLMGTILISMGIAFMIIGLVITWKHAKRELQKEVDAAGPTAADYRISDDKLSPWRSPKRKTADVPASPTCVEDADLYITDYFMMQCLGEGHQGVEGDEHGRATSTNGSNSNVPEEDYYQTNLTWNEMILDDFS